MLTPRTPKSAGLSLLEVAFAITLMTVGLLGAMAATVRSISLNEDVRLESLALAAAHSNIEQLRGHDVAEVFTRFNATTTDDPTGVSPGNTFSVAGLDAASDGVEGAILFPTRSSAPAILTELPDSDGDFGGLALDLDLNGATNDADVTADFKVLPVLVRVRWRGRTGDREIELFSQLADIP